jgi:hypothetical protein
MEVALPTGLNTAAASNIERVINARLDGLLLIKVR